MIRFVHNRFDLMMRGVFGQELFDTVIGIDSGVPAESTESKRSCTPRAPDGSVIHPCSRIGI